MNDVDFPCPAVLEGIDAAAAAGLPVKINAVVKRGANDGDIVALAEHFRGRATSSASSSTWTSARRTAGGSRTSSRAEEIVERIGERWPLEPVAAERPRRDGARAGATSTAPARSA